MKKVFAIVLTTIFAVIPIFQACAEHEPSSINVEVATKTAIEASKQMIIGDYIIRTKESELRTAKDNVGKQNKYTSSQELLENKIKDEVKPLQAEDELDAAKRKKQEDEKSIRINVYKTIFEYLLTEKQLAAEKAKLSLDQERLDMLAKQYETGIITESDLIDSQYEMDNSRSNIGNHELRLQSQALEIKRLLGLPMNNMLFKIEENIVPLAWNEYDLDELINKALKFNGNIREKEKSIMRKEMIFNFTKEYFKQGESSYEQNATSVEIGKSELIDAKLKLEIDIRNKYNDLLNAKERLDLNEKYINLVKKKLKYAEIKFKSGIISKSVLIDLQKSLIDAEFQRLGTICDYNIKSFEFKAMYVDIQDNFSKD